MDRKYITWLIISQPFFLFTLCIFIANEIEFDIVKPLFIQSYLNDLLAPSLLLSLTSVLLSLIYRVLYVFSKAQMFFFFLYLSFVFELLLPYLSDAYIADKYDVVCYALGTLLFHYFINRKLNELKRPYSTS